MIEIASDQLSAVINPFGAELTHLRDAEGRELMTDADPRWWTGHAPLLFPVVGKPYRETIRVDGREYPMKQHGFARRKEFALVEQSTDAVTFSLTDSEATRAQYPFAFRLDAAYRIKETTLHVDIAVRNMSDVPLPASFGFHPAFAWPLPYGRAREDHRIVFAQDEPDALRVIAGDGTIAAGERTSPLDGRTLHLDDDLFAKDALIWDRVRSDRVTDGADAGPQLVVDFPDTPMLGIWMKPGARYVCIEPWHGIADPEGFEGDLADKPGIFIVQPGDAKRIAMRVTLTA